jgi:hypothetical protein
MPEKTQAERPAKRRARTSKQPRKTPQKDYSSLPQKPIKLKQDVSLAPALKPGKRMTNETTPTPKKKTERKAHPHSSKPFAQLSPQIREIALAAAAREGVSLDAWLEALILQFHRATPQAESEASGSVLQSLQRIERRLERLEDQRGFWRRFWDQFMEADRR